MADQKQQGNPLMSLVHSVEAAGADVNKVMGRAVDGIDTAVIGSVDALGKATDAIGLGALGNKMNEMSHYTAADEEALKKKQAEEAAMKPAAPVVPETRAQYELGKAFIAL